MVYYIIYSIVFQYFLIYDRTEQHEKEITKDKIIRNIQNTLQITDKSYGFKEIEPAVDTVLKAKGRNSNFGVPSFCFGIFLLAIKLYLLAIKLNIAFFNPILLAIKLDLLAMKLDLDNYCYITTPSKTKSLQKAIFEL